MKLPPDCASRGDLASGAIFACSKPYRYALWRNWSIRGGQCAFIGLNPSTADEKANDQTMRRCINFAKSWGFGGVIMVNLFAFRATDPEAMKKQSDPVGEYNDFFTAYYAARADRIVCAWGAHGAHMGRGQEIYTRLQSLNGDRTLYCLGTTKSGQPKHPVRLRADTPLAVYEGGAA